MNDLKSLAIHYVTDKVKTCGHDYIPGYVDLFESNETQCEKDAGNWNWSWTPL